MPSIKKASVEITDESDRAGHWKSAPEERFSSTPVGVDTPHYLMPLSIVATSVG